jgi:hypothetical protein
MKSGTVAFVIFCIILTLVGILALVSNAKAEEPDNFGYQVYLPVISFQPDNPPVYQEVKLGYDISFIGWLGFGSRYAYFFEPISPDFMVISGEKFHKVELKTSSIEEDRKKGNYSFLLVTKHATWDKYFVYVKD